MDELSANRRFVTLVQIKPAGLVRLMSFIYQSGQSQTARFISLRGNSIALTLYLCGFYGCACGGRTLSDKQTIILRDYKVCVALDADSAGRAGLVDMGRMLRGLGVSEVSFVRPPKGRKDWNALYIEVGQEVLAPMLGRLKRNSTSGVPTCWSYMVGS